MLTLCMPKWSVHILAASDRSLVKEYGPQAVSLGNSEKEHRSKAQVNLQANHHTTLELFWSQITGPSISHVRCHQNDGLRTQAAKQCTGSSTRGTACQQIIHKPKIAVPRKVTSRTRSQAKQPTRRLLTLLSAFSGDPATMRPEQRAPNGPSHNLCNALRQSAWGIKSPP